MIDYNALEQFVAFSQAGTLSEVAEHFSISQPTITRNMKKIEDAFGVSLFTRGKNHIELNDTGRLAAEEAARVLKQTQDMFRRVRTFDKSQHTISIGSCIVLPVPDLIRRVSTISPSATISTEVKMPNELITGLYNDMYHLIILPYEPDDTAVSYVKIEEEHLMFLLPKDHPLAGRESLSMSEMNGQNLLLFQEVGFWKDIVDKKLPDSRFLIQNERYSLMELIENSVMPAFTTDLASQYGIPKNRISIPITDPEVNVSYYLVCKEENRKRFSLLFS